MARTQVMKLSLIPGDSKRCCILTRTEKDLDLVKSRMFQLFYKHRKCHSNEDVRIHG